MTTIQTISIFPSFELSRQTITHHDGKVFEYYLLSNGLGRAQNPPYQSDVFVVANHTDKGWVLGISESYPQEWRDVALRHEIAEKYEPNPEHGCDACKRVLLCELLEVGLMCGDDTDRYLAYVTFRLRFFQEVVAYYQVAPRDAITVALLECLIRSRDTLVEHRDMLLARAGLAAG